MSTEHSAPEGDKAELATRTEGLVKRLRMAARHPYMNNTCPANIFDVADACDRIEELERIVDAARLAHDLISASNERLRRDLAEQQRHSGRKPTVYAHDPQGFIDETSTGAALPHP